MRIVYAFLCLLLVAFAAFQINDPDWWWWGGIYALAAVFTGVAAFRPGLYAAGAWTGAFAICLALALAGVFYYWPDTPGWWRPEVWSDAAVMSDGTETAREGMGMMIVAAAMLLVGVVVLAKRRA